MHCTRFLGFQCSLLSRKWTHLQRVLLCKIWGFWFGFWLLRCVDSILLKLFGIRLRVHVWEWCRGCASRFSSRFALLLSCSARFEVWGLEFWTRWTLRPSRKSIGAWAFQRWEESGGGICPWRARSRSLQGPCIMRDLEGSILRFDRDRSGDRCFGNLDVVAWSRQKLIYLCREVRCVQGFDLQFLFRRFSIGLTWREV